jgi:hypothetical protein
MRDYASGRMIRIRGDYNPRIKYIKTIYSGSCKRPEAGLQKVVYKDYYADRVVPQNFFTDRKWDYNGNRNLDEKCRIRPIDNHAKNKYKEPIDKRRLNEKINKMNLALSWYLLEKMFEDMFLYRNTLKFSKTSNSKIEKQYIVKVLDGGNGDIRPMIKVVRGIRKLNGFFPHLFISTKLRQDLIKQSKKIHKLRYETLDLQSRIKSYRRHYGLNKRRNSQAKTKKTD